MIREGALEGLDEALELATLLESDVQRAWCLGDLVQHWQLDNEQLNRVLDAAPQQSRAPACRTVTSAPARFAAGGRALSSRPPV